MLALVVFAAMVASALLAPVVLAADQDGSGWSSPILLYSSTDVSVRDPLVVADASGGMHVFLHTLPLSDSAPELNRQQILYTMTPGGDSPWTAPTDIVSARTASPSSATADPHGYLHLLLRISGASLHYERASISDAGSARSWSKARAVAPANSVGQIASDANGRLYRVFAGLGSSGVYCETSEDGGLVWSLPVSVSRTLADAVSADWVRVAIGPDGTVHVVWTEWQFPSAWPPLGVHYSRSSDGGRTWSQPFELAGKGYDQVNVAVTPQNVVHVAWNGMAGNSVDPAVGGRHHRYSMDGGNTWSDVDVLTTEGFTEGYPQLVVDSAGGVHVLTTYKGRVWYASWQGKSWDPLSYVSTGDEAGIPPLDAPPQTKMPREIEQVTAAIGTGNKLHVVFWDKRLDQGITKVWYTEKSLSAPAVAALPLPTILPTSTATARPVVSSPTPGADRTVMASAASPTDERLSDGSSAPGFAAAIPAVLLVGGFLLASSIHRISR